MTPNLDTTWLGLPLPHPLVASAGPLTHHLDGFRRLEDAGVSAVVMHSLFEEQINREGRRAGHFADLGSESYAESLNYLPHLENLSTGPDRYLDLLSSARESLAIPVIASLNGSSPGGWCTYARRLQEAGASALELNLYHLPTDPSMSGADVESRYLDTVREVAATISIPLAVKLSPFLSAPAHFAKQLAAAGASGLILFNRFYQPDFDLSSLRVEPKLVLSRPDELRLPLRWIALLDGRVAADLAITSGVHSAEAVLKSVMAGAHVTMLTSELLRHGLGRIREILDAVTRWMVEHEYDSITQMRGSMSHRHTANPGEFERANYLATLQSWSPP